MPRLHSNLKALISNGRTWKGIDPWNPDDSPEAWTSGAPKEDSRKLVPVVFAAWQLRAKALTDLPFAIYGKGDTEIDNSDDYQNKLGFLPDPYQMFWKWESALCGYGSYYAFNEHNNAKTLALKYWRPDTVEPKFDEKTGDVIRFIRDYGRGKIDYLPEDVLYCWLPDPAVEVGPPTVWPLKSALIAASALDSVNQFVAEFAERGMTKMFLLAMKGNPPPQEKERIESWWNSFMNRVRNIRWRVFNADSITPTVIGDGLEALNGSEITNQLQEQILEAMGVPASLVMANAANYATAQQDVRTFYQNTVLPDARIIQSSLNVQILNPQGYSLEFQPERLETFQTDESERAASLAVLAGVLSDSKPEAITLSMDILGYDLTDDQERMLADLVAAKEEARETMAAIPSTSDTLDESTTDTDTELIVEKGLVDELRKWERKAVKSIGRDVTFLSDAIPQEIQLQIHAALPGCKTIEEVRAVFDAVDPSVTITAKSDIQSLADALFAAVKIMDIEKGQTNKEI